MNRPCLNHALALRALLLAALSLTILAGCGAAQTSAPSTPEEQTISTIIRVHMGVDPLREQHLAVSGPFQIYDLATRKLILNPAYMTRGTFTASPEGLRLNGLPLNAPAIEIVPRNAASIQILTADAQGRFIPAGYRGNMRVISRGQLVSLVNVLHIDDYLYSVVGKETYSVRWHLESQKAQAVAARSYALYEALTTGRRDFDVYDAPGKSQAYPGFSSETDKSRQAVDETRGMALTWDDGGRQKIVHAFYSSTCGGQTVAPSAAGLNEPTSPPLAGVECTWCRDTRNYRWTATISQADLRRAIAPLVPQLRIDEVTGIAIPDAGRNPDGSAKAIVVTVRSQGRTEPIAIRPGKLREVFSTLLIKSTRITAASMTAGQATIEGLGFGHRVGLCQFGAEAQAQAGRTAPQILQLYYPTSQLTKVY